MLKGTWFLEPRACSGLAMAFFGVARNQRGHRNECHSNNKLEEFILKMTEDYRPQRKRCSGRSSLLQGKTEGKDRGKRDQWKQSSQEKKMKVNI